MTKVSQTEFFKVMNPLNVHPRVDVASFKQEWTVSHWEMQDHSRRIVGVSKSRNGGSEYFLAA